VSDLKQRIQDGLDGKFEGLGNGFNRLNKYLFGVQRKCYTLLGGQSGTFKTTLADYIVSNAIQDASDKNIKLDVFYYSFEIDKLSKQCNWLSSIIYRKYGIEISPEKIKGLGDVRLSESEADLVSKEIPEVEEMFSKINFTFKPTNPTGLYMDLWKHGQDNGTFEYEHYIDANGDTKRKISKYIPNNPDAYTLVVMDHAALSNKERGFTTKETLDKLSEYIIELRNMFGFSFLVLQQFNQGLSSVERAKFKGVDLSPQQSDFKDSTNLYQDADIVLGTMNPYKLDLHESLGYDINKLKSNMIMLKIIKNRLSTDNIAIGLGVNPRAGCFEELPPSSEMTPDMYDEVIRRLRGN
jgi:hypothetical protein